MWCKEMHQYQRYKLIMRLMWQMWSLAPCGLDRAAAPGGYTAWQPIRVLGQSWVTSVSALAVNIRRRGVGGLSRDLWEGWDSGLYDGQLLRPGQGLMALWSRV